MIKHLDKRIESYRSQKHDILCGCVEGATEEDIVVSQAKLYGRNMDANALDHFLPF
ncbi:MAG: hypothetical protein AB2L11_02065 [Syntrophobacteraceae bacterium]